MMVHMHPHGNLSTTLIITHTQFVCVGGEGKEDWIHNPVLVCEPVGSGYIATGSVQKNAAFRWTFVKSSWVMSWIANGYELWWSGGAPASREVPNSPSALAHEAFVFPALAEMLEAGDVSKLPVGYKPEVVSPLGVVPKGKEGKFRLIISMSYVNDHLVTNKFKFEGLSDLADLAEKGDHALSFDLTSGYYHVGLHPRTRTYTGFFGRGITTSATASRLG